MALTKEDLGAIKSLLTPLEVRISALEDHLTKFEERVDERFNAVDQNFDALFKRDETREQEYLILTEQVARLEQRVSTLEKGRA